jgi:hypothetical protein
MRGTSIQPDEYAFQIEPSAGLYVLERRRLAAPPTAE